MDKIYKALVVSSYNISQIETGFFFRTADDRPCELTITPHLEIYKGETLLTAGYALKVSGHFYTYGSSHSESGLDQLSQFSEMYEILRKRYENQTEKAKGLMYSFVESLAK